MNQNNTKISDKIRELDDRLQNIARQADAQEEQMSQNLGFQFSHVKNDLEEDLRQIEQSVQLLSKICLLKMVNTNDHLSQMEVHLDQVDGSLRAIRANAGRKLVPTPQPAECFRTIDDQFLPRAKMYNLEFPKEPFRINLNAISAVGRRIEEDNLSLIHI